MNAADLQTQNIFMAEAFALLVASTAILMAANTISDYITEIVDKINKLQLLFDEEAFPAPPVDQEDDQ